MKARRIIVLGIVLLGGLPALGDIGGHGAASAAATAPNWPLKPDLRRLPLTFEASADISGTAAEYSARGLNYGLYLEPAAAVFVLGLPGDEPSASFRMRLEGAASDAPMSAEARLPGVSHYFVGSDPGLWRTNVPHYAKVRAADVYPGVDVLYYGNQGQLEFDLEIEPGVDPAPVILAFEGVQDLKIDAGGDLLADLGRGKVILRRPVAYQGTKDSPQPVEACFVRLSADRVGFKVGPYDRSRALVIDPPIAYATYFGSGEWELFSGIAVDISGALYVEGSTQSAIFPTSNALYPGYLGGLFDAFVTKINAAGTAILFSTYFGGSERDTGAGIAVDGDGDIYLTGDTDSRNFPVVGAFQGMFGGTGSVGFGDAFIAKMKSDGSALVYSSYLGGSGDDLAMGIALDGEGNAYITGVTESANFPTVNAYKTTRGGNLDAFVSKVNPAGSALVYSTYFGGSGTETSYGFGDGGIAVTADGTVCIVGYTLSTDFPLLNAYQSTYRGGTYCGDAFVTKFDPSGTALVFSTLLGGSGDDLAGSVAMDPNGGVYVAGKTKSSNFPTQNAFQGTYGGGEADGFVAAFSPDGSTLRYSTFFGWSGYDSVSDIAVDGLGNAYIVGGVESASFPTVDPIQAAMSGSGDAYVTVFSADGSSLLFSTYLGGTGGDSAAFVRLDTSGAIYLAGGASAGFPTTDSSPMPDPPVPSGGLYLAKIEALVLIPGPDLLSIAPSSASAGDAGFTLVVRGGTFVNGAVVRWGGGNRPTAFVSETELHADIATADLAAGRTVVITVRNPDGGVSDSLTFTINNPVPALGAASPARACGGGAGCTTTLTGTNFVPNSAAHWNGSPLTTTYVSATELQATVPSALVETPGEFPLTVVNPTPAGGSSEAVTFTVSGYTADATPTSATVTAGQSATYDIRLTPQFGVFDSAVGFSCIGLPGKCTATFAPVSVTPGADPATTRLTLQTTAPSNTGSSAAGLSGTGGTSAGPFAVALTILLIGGLLQLPPRDRRRGWLAACALVGLIVLISACSAGGGGNGSDTGTPKGTRTITVQAVSGALRVTTSITLTVQ
jgi:hypothetical protein